MYKTAQDAYAQGFMDRCAEYGIDGEELIKEAQFMPKLISAIRGTGNVVGKAKKLNKMRNFIANMIEPMYYEPRYLMQKLRGKGAKVLSGTQIDDLIAKGGNKKFVKNPNVVYHATPATEAKKIYTLEGKVMAKPGDTIMTGAIGERWPIKPGKLESKYVPIKGKPGAFTPIVGENAPVNIAFPDKSFKVNTNWGSELLGKPGDALVRYGPDDFGIVEKGIFGKTYNPFTG